MNGLNSCALRSLEERWIVGGDEWGVGCGGGGGGRILYVLHEGVRGG